MATYLVTTNNLTQKITKNYTIDLKVFSLLPGKINVVDVQFYGWR